MKNFKLQKLVISAILIALAIVFDLIISSIPNTSMPMGGSFIGISMIPLVLIGLLFGLKYGLLSAVIYALYSFSFDYLIYLSTLKALLESYTNTPWTTMHIVGFIFFDYILALGAYGLAGLFIKTGLKTAKNVVTTVVFVSLIRYISATISGVLLWGNSIKLASEAVKNGDDAPNIATRLFSFFNGNVFLYSAVYNFIYIFTTTAIVILILLATRKRLLTITEKYQTI